MFRITGQVCRRRCEPVKGGALSNGEQVGLTDYRIWLDKHKDRGFGYRDHAIDWNSWMGRPSHLPEHLHPTYWTAQQVIDWLDRRGPERPFFLKVSFAGPHSPYDPPEVYCNLYRDRRMPEPFIGGERPAKCVLFLISTVGFMRRV